MKTLYYKIYKKLVLLYLICLSLLLVLTSCVIDPYSDCVENHKYSVSEAFEYILNVGNQDRLEIDGINGSMEIIGISESGNLEIWGEKEVQSESRRDAEEYLQRLTVNIVEENDRYVIYTRQPSQSSNRNFIVHYFLRVPKNWTIYFNQSNGSVFISSFENEVSGGVTNGDINVEDIFGTVNVKSTNGNIRLWHVEGTAKGRITNGNIEAKIYLVPQAIAEFSTVNGKIELLIPEDTSAELGAAVVNGNIFISNLTIFDLVKTKKTLQGKLGAGEGRITVETVNGNVSVTGF